MSNNMSDTFSSLAIADQRLYLEIPQTSDTAEIVDNQLYSTSGAKQRALINQQCLDGFLCWLREDIYLNPKIYPNTLALPSFWEVLNGTAITVDNLRLVLIPTLAMDGEELRVFQEWIDIPELVGDYYFAIQVNPDENWMRILGYATHLQLKTTGVYDPRDRSYCLETENLIPDINVLWISRQYTQEKLRAEVSPLTPLPKAQADNLLQRLGNPNINFTRLEVPFIQWGGLFTHGGWRQKLYELRQGIKQQQSISQWLDNGISSLAQQWGWEERRFISTPSGMRSQELAILGFSRQLEIANNNYELRVFPHGNPESQIWRFELRCLSPDNQIPMGFKLILLTEDLQSFENNQDTAITPVDLLYIEVMLEPGEGLVWETLPLSEDYNREILRF
jgi:Protein of unknown function (DUF1822)